MKPSQDTTPRNTETSLKDVVGWVQDLMDLHALIAPRSQK
jgi:hypothetical protein